MGRATGGRGSRRAAQVAGWLAAAALLAHASVGWLPTQLLPAAESSTSVRLVDDQAGRALFTATGLVPGQVEQRCVALSVSGAAQASSGVALSARVSQADLAPYLSVGVERGSLADPAQCGTFTGQQVFSGTLAQFPTTPATGVPTGWQPGAEQQAVFRFTVGVLDDQRAQGVSARASFVWSLDEAPEAVSVPPVAGPVLGPGAAPAPVAGPVPPTASVPVPTPLPRTVAVPPRSAAGVAPPAAPAPSQPAPSQPDLSAGQPTAAAGPPAGTGAGPGGTAGDRSGRGSTSGDVLLAPPLEASPSSLVEVAAALAEVALAVADDSQFPLALVAIVLGFVALQGRLDRRDPKLALAPVRHDLSGFPDFPERPRRASS